MRIYDFRDDLTGDALRVSLLDGDRLAVAIALDDVERVVVLVDGRRRAGEIAAALGDLPRAPTMVRL